MSTVYDMKPVTIYAPDSKVENMRTWFDDIAFRLDEINRAKFSMLNPFRYEVAIGLYLISEYKLWTVSEYSSVRDFANKVLGLKSVAVTMYLKVAKLMLRKDAPLNIFGNDDFTITQLYKMSVLDVDELKVCVEDRIITPEMTIKEIESVISKWNLLDIDTFDSVFKNLQDRVNNYCDRLYSINTDSPEAHDLVIKIQATVSVMHDEAIALKNRCSYVVKGRRKGNR